MKYTEQEVGEIISYQEQAMDLIYNSMFGGEKTPETENPYQDRPYPDEKGC